MKNKTGFFLIVFFITWNNILKGKFRTRYQMSNKIIIISYKVIILLISLVIFVLPLLISTDIIWAKYAGFTFYTLIVLFVRTVIFYLIKFYRWLHNLDMPTQIIAIFI